MEAATLMTIAKYRGAKPAAIPPVSDKLRHIGEWIKGFQSRRLKQQKRLQPKQPQL